MFHNVKADIIYYKTATDFELEFNLCGCCRMRLLSDKVSDKKAFIGSLARAVSRSRVILVAGALFGEENSISSVAEAIGTSTETISNAQYGISGEDEIRIIKGSTPLVTAQGYFGGCIIESGPQTMIVLTDNKNIRKTIMQNLIHPYIEELYAAELSEQGEYVPTDQEIAQEESEIILDTAEQPELPIDQTDDNQELILEDQDEQPQETYISEEDVSLAENMVFEETEPEEAPQDDEDTVDLFFEPTKLDARTVQRFTEEYTYRADAYDDDEEDYYRKNMPSQKRGMSLAVLIISIILLLTLVVLCYCIFFVPTRQGISPVSYLQEIYNTLFS